MPSKSKKQHNLMEMVAHNPAKAKELKIPQSVGKEFVAADKGKKFGTGGNVGYTVGGQNQINKQRTRFGSVFGTEKNIPNVNNNKYIGKKEGGIMKHDDLAQDKKLIKKAFGMHDKQLHENKKTNLSKLKGGGMAKETMGPKTMAKDVEKGSNKLLKHGESAVQKRGHTKGSEERGYKKLGLQGGAKSGKGTFGAAPIKMRKGGKCYDEGGDIETETAQGQNKNIGDDVRSRAMAAMANREQDIGGGGKTDVTAPAKPATPTLPSRKAFVSKANKAGFAADQTGGGAALMTRKDRKTSGMAKGGVTRGDGIASRGKTRGKMC